MTYIRMTSWTFRSVMQITRNQSIIPVTQLKQNSQNICGSLRTRNAHNNEVRLQETLKIMGWFYLTLVITI